MYIDYYWRFYNGDIPKDAVVGGQDLDHRPTYIGQALVYSDGKFANVPSELIAGQETNYFPLNNNALAVRTNILVNLS